MHVQSHHGPAVHPLSQHKRLFAPEASRHALRDTVLPEPVRQGTENS
jgi:hypothetical protein